MRIGEVSRLTGLPASTIRYYEANGLIASAQRHANGYREYPETVLGMLGMIKVVQQLGFSLDDIRALVPVAGHAEWSPDQLIASLQAKLEEIASLQRLLTQSAAQLNQFVTLLQNRPEHATCDERRMYLIQQLTLYTLATAAEADTRDLASALSRVAAR